MKFRYCIFSLFLIGFTTSLKAQLADQVLFSVGDMEVTVSEFKYIYEKNNQEALNYDEEKVTEYLNLYKNFKLKVLAAIDAGLDTLPAIHDEINNYKDLISKSYLIDKEVLEKMALNTFDRMQEDRSFSHIFVKVTSSDSLAAYQKIANAKKDLDNGMSFVNAVAKYSEDDNTRDQDGDIGYMSAPFSNGFYEFENAVYSVEVGEVSDIVRSKAGYHIVKLNEIRPAKGTMQAAHIFVSKPTDGDSEKLKAAQDKINNAYQALQDGQDFQDVVKKYSEDRAHIANGGYIGRIAVNSYSAAFEDAAFSLKDDNAYTEVVETSVGYHIIRRISAEKPTEQSFAERKDELINIIRNTERFNTAMNNIINSVYKEGELKVYEDNLKAYIANLDSSFITFSWKAPINNNKLIVYNKSGLTFTGNDFGKFLSQNSSDRLRLRNIDNIEEDIMRLFDIYKRETAMKYEEGLLDSKYPEFRHLIREYREGILLFEITKERVWDKAAQDTAGLMVFFDGHRQNYQWDKRAVVLEYTFKGLDGHKAEDISHYVATHSSEEVIQNYGQEHVTFRTHNIEKGSSRDKFVWEKNKIFSINKNKEDGILQLNKLEKILDSELKTLDESRGYVISDYQLTLEQAWIKELEDKYPYKLDESIFNQLMK